MSDELSAALRELADARATAPVVGGPATRALAIRRRRRRRAAATLGAGTAALALLGLALTLQLGGGRDYPAGRGTSAVTPSGSAPLSAATPAPAAGTLDLPGRDLTFGGRTMPILSTLDLSPGFTSTAPMTVVAKPVRIALAVDVLSEGSTVVNVMDVVELRDGEGGPLYVGAFTPDIKASGDYDVRGGVIALGAEDAQWFYARIGLGDTIAVTVGTAPAATPSAAATAPGHTASPPDEADLGSPLPASAPVGAGAE
ncbi:hypothetical protein [Streptomyces rishiriensis]|uniref:Uncharacterized protein n=1 Tax=Streptomyces rishiriensis TaxID=68264 RepID=A0ABU0NQ47_STRRH|nr:hypothetical protein [Streptomyces rishiriensis]MDQ0580853.1 hypothetical protein [Streptomyces rishiriensis]